MKRKSKIFINRIMAWMLLCVMLFSNSTVVAQASEIQTALTEEMVYQQEEQPQVSNEEEETDNGDADMGDTEKKDAGTEEGDSDESGAPPDMGDAEQDAVDESISGNTTEEADEETVIEDELPELPDEEIETYCYINPLYEDIISEEDLVEPDESQFAVATYSDDSFSSLESAAEYVRQQMVARTATIVVNIDTTLYSYKDIFDAAVETDENSTGVTGESLKFQYGGWYVYRYYGCYVYTLTYYTTADQEVQVTNKVAEILSQLNLEDKSEYDKIIAIHDYLTGTIDYGTASATQEQPYLPYTTYGALVKKLCVCQGYALAFYRLCSEVGVSSRIITSKEINHAWNIVRIDGLYYNIDCTWDDPVGGYPNYNYFLQSDADFKGHPRDAQYMAESFYDRYPMAIASYGKETPSEVTDPDKVNKDNSAMNYTFTTLSEEKVTTQAEGRPKLIVFYRTTCANSQGVIQNLVNMDLSGIDVVAAEFEGKAKSDVESFASTYGGNGKNKQITFVYDTTTETTKLMWKYLRMAGNTSSSISLPVVIYIDGNNYLQHASTGYMTASELSAMIDKYCKSITNYLTYKVIYKANSGTGSDYSETWTTENPYTVLDNSVTKFTNGKRGFQGWNTKANGQGTAYLPGGEIKIPVSTPMVLYAQWDSNPATSVTITPETRNILVGDTIDYQMTYTAKEEGETSDEAVWKSSDATVIKVDKKGRATGLKAGTATITVTLGNVSDSSEITVIDSLTLDKTSTDLVSGERITLTTSLIPTNGSVEWKSSDSGIVRMESAGTTENGTKAEAVFLGVKQGTATITVTCGKYTAKCTVKVAEQVAAPEADYASGSIDKNTVVKLGSDTVGATIYYTVDGTDPTVKSTKYNDKTGIRISGDTTLKAIAVKKGFLDSKIKVFEYTIAKVTVTFDTADGENGPQAQTLRRGDYLDGERITQPVRENYKFTGWYTDVKDADTLLDLTQPVLEDVQYIAGWQESTKLYLSANYSGQKKLPDGAKIVLQATEKVTTDGEVTEKLVDNAKIYYTLDGTVPTTDSILYTEPIVLYHIEGQQVLRAIAVGNDYLTSDELLRTYEILSEEETEDIYGEIDPADVPDNVDITEGKLWTAGVETSYVYTGAAIKPAIRVYDGTTRLKEKRDYTVRYINNVKVTDQAQIQIKGIGNYSGNMTISFAITAKDISDSDITVEDIYIIGNGKVQKKAPVVKWNKKTLKNKTDYVIDYGNGEYKDAGKYTITITGNGNYTGTRMVTEVIADKNTEYLISRVKVTIDKKAVLSYTGQEICPAVTVTNGRIILKEGIDYELSYSHNMEIGNAVIRIKGLNDYIGVKQVGFKITGVPVSKITVAGFMKELPYTPGVTAYVQSELALTYSYKDANKQMHTENLTESQDYTVEYVNNTKAGRATLILTGKGKYTGVKKLSYTIKPNGTDLANADIEYTQAVAYSKGGAKAEVTAVRIGDVILEPDVDYTVRYANITKVAEADTKKAPTITIVGKGNYKGSVTRTYAIVAKELSNVTLTAENRIWSNSKNNYTTKVTLTDTDEKALRLKTDYTLQYYLEDGTVISSGTKVPSGTKIMVEATGAGNYAGTRATSFYVADYNIGKVKMDKIADRIYTGKEITLDKGEIKGTIVVNGQMVTLNEEDFEIIGYKNNQKKGNATVTLRGISDTFGGTITLKFRIVEKNMNDNRL